MFVDTKKSNAPKLTYKVSSENNPYVFSNKTIVICVMKENGGKHMYIDQFKQFIPDLYMNIVFGICHRRQTCMYLN